MARIGRTEQAAPEVHLVTPDRFEDLADLFMTNGATRGCWCMSFIGERRDVIAGYRSGGNRRSFEAMARTEPAPMGLIAYEGAVPVGWCAAGPRSRYERTIGPRAEILRDRDPAEDDAVWLVPCFFVRVGHRRRGTTRRLLNAAVEVARAQGARAVEGFPIVDGYKRTADSFLGTEQLFADCGFVRINHPSPRRVVMRLDLQ